MSRVYLSEKADGRIFDYFRSQGHTVCPVNGGDAVYAAVACHPDVYYCGDADGAVFHGDKSLLGRDYPENVRYNAVLLDKYFIHNLRYTDEKLLEYAVKTGRTPVSVRQGYTKCSTVVVSGNAVITADKGIIKALKNLPALDALEIEGGHVAIEGHDEGFIGGASGRVGDEIVFSGDLSAHPDYEKIIAFIENHGLRVKYFPEFPLTDIGTIIEEKGEYYGNC